MSDISLGGYVAALPGQLTHAAGQVATFFGKTVTTVHDALPLVAEQSRQYVDHLLQATHTTLRWTKAAAVYATGSVKQVAASVHANASSAGEYVVPHVRQAINTGISAGTSAAATVVSHIECAQHCIGEQVAQIFGESAQLTALASTRIEALGITAGELAKTVGLYGAVTAPLTFPLAELAFGGIYRLLTSYRISRADDRAQRNYLQATRSADRQVLIATERAFQLRQESAFFKKLSERSVCSVPNILKTTLSCLPVLLVVPQIGLPTAAAVAAGGIVTRLAAHALSSSRYARLAEKLSDKAAHFSNLATASHERTILQRASSSDQSDSSDSETGANDRPFHRWDIDDLGRRPLDEHRFDRLHSPVRPADELVTLLDDDLPQGDDFRVVQPASCAVS